MKKLLSLEALLALQRRCRFSLLLSTLFFLIALFALVSRWTAAYALIVFSCLFYMLSRRLSKRRYAEAFTQVRMQHLFSKDGRGFSSYSPSESAENALHDRGLISGPPCISGAKFHHVVHGTLSGLPVSIGEAAFVRRSAQHAIHSVAGTLITVSGLLPPEEKWVILRNDPFASFCAPGEYRSAGYAPFVPEADALPANTTAWQCPSASCTFLPACADTLASGTAEAPAALAACDGALSLFVTGAFYAPGNVDFSAAISPEAIDRFQFTPLTLIDQLVKHIAHA
ncbi:MAG TPA: hypothetical protein IAC19_02370 [Candidatus Ventricola gallistercoris]|nr:hypothetical protein [Candidatus Ventricola gallistercoris]